MENNNNELDYKQVKFIKNFLTDERIARLNELMRDSRNKSLVAQYNNYDEVSLYKKARHFLDEIKYENLEGSEKQEVEDRALIIFASMHPYIHMKQKVLQVEELSPTL